MSAEASGESISSEVRMQDETRPAGEPQTDQTPSDAESQRNLPVARAELLPMRRSETRPAKSGLRQIAELLEEAAGLTLDVLDVTGDMIAERLGLRRSSTRTDA